MPLSEHEQRLLEQMEQQLLSDDPRFASTMRGPRRAGGGKKSLVLGVSIAVAGLAALVAILFLIPLSQRGWVYGLGGAAFLVMLGGILYAVSGAGGGRAESGPIGVVGADGRPGPRPATGPRGPRARRSGTFMQRLEQRWDRRRDDRWG
ncbi:Protein of unknown function [Quadrisphaera granulorum]|uniref:DUF3040 family protein n=1 Tax=Quadrisphaera granulorum TaxID=317664 RepID=A0A316A8C1_9ACTN|nr:DUF3040 domain-containing protein [Quadrisphaera granulorum]PWJ53689.1 Protein of unknown function (DUF3040) [Quadrisphaera granulorum]SZE96733.1 Protein of unknown function [Quadrisphaera granulorum]